MKPTNKLLSALQKEIKKTGIKIEISGFDFLVNPVSAQTQTQLIKEAEREATRKLASRKKQLESEKLTKEEIELVTSQLQGTRGETSAKELAASMKTRYDLEKYGELVNYFAVHLFPEILSTMEGLPVYETEDERKQIVELLKRSPESVRRIDAALVELQKKSEPLPPQ